MQPKARQIDKMSPIDISKELLVEMNKIRQNPKSIVHELEKTIEILQKSKTLEKEQIICYEEAIFYQNRQKPLEKFILKSGLTKSALDHARDMGANDMKGHIGTDNSTLRDRVEKYGKWARKLAENIAYGGGKKGKEIQIQQLVDKHTPSRANRGNVFNEELNVCGIGVSPHKNFGSITVIDFAYDFSDKND